ncbi:uncharacterized protein LOC114373284 [Glycine soja]|uniref:uncharacterized mitochondrial protein AtMg00820-like n=1 Tax=Glycine max TaxID=3847 RepID=UPI0007192FB6|nr:uncharacterized mitochondrial protein AtMg00820-like [Glycine max]XP_028186587.1 uncharacterized protein LOC114373284 [Glycine soja]|eukprot:XP_014627136.1 uncharacterized protein LOC106797371 [Glycine max]
MRTCAKSGIGKPRINSTLLIAHLESKSTKATLKYPSWKTAMQTKYDALIKNETWTLIDLPSSKTAIGYKWIFRVKENPDGSVNKYKVRLPFFSIPFLFMHTVMLIELLTMMIKAATTVEPQANVAQAQHSVAQNTNSTYDNYNGGNCFLNNGHGDGYNFSHGGCGGDHGYGDGCGGLWWSIFSNI